MTVTLFLLNKKGYQCLEVALSNVVNWPSIQLVVIGKDQVNQLSSGMGSSDYGRYLKKIPNKNL